MSFLKSESVIFHLTEQNIEDMDGLNDIWAQILNENLLDSINKNFNNNNNLESDA